MRVFIAAVVLTGLATVAAGPLLGHVGAAGQPAASQPSGSSWDGVYSEEQATRGQNTFLNECARCHAESLLGTSDGGPPLVGETFSAGWAGKPVGELFELIQKTMPQDSAGKLTRQETANLVAYIFKANGCPPGQGPLPADPGPLGKMQVRFTGSPDR